MDDETLLQTVKNGLMVAGHEMGPVGDHWPAIHAISKGLEKEFAECDRDQAVVGELEFHIATIFRDLEEAAEQCSPKEKKEIQKMMKGLWDHYYAIFESVEAKHEPSLEDLLPEGSPKVRNMSAAARIIKDMGGRV
ncbi:MAG: hypothetical protein EB059_04130 [Alphaproteobacteria bacterium]|nr:hypothetical protein [Alphaproteobacteria bacterium]